MAPEQLEGKPAGPAADIYAFGVVMYEMAVNAVPHQNESPLLIAVRRLKEKPQPPHLVNQNVDPRWEAAILRCLETRPEDRFANPEAIVAAIESRHSLSLPYIRASRIKRVGWLGVAAASMALVGGLGFYQVSKPASLSPEAQRLFREGENAIADGAFLKASLQLEKVVAQQPDHLLAAVRLAEAYYEYASGPARRTSAGKETQVKWFVVCSNFISSI